MFIENQTLVNIFKATRHLIVPLSPVTFQGFLLSKVKVRDVLNLKQEIYIVVISILDII